MEYSCPNYELACGECGKRYGNRPLSACPDCLAPLEVVYDLLSARGVFTRVWSQNQLLSREEAFACGYRPSEEDLIVNDERQYRIAVTSIPFFRARAQATFAALKAELLRNGYGMSAKPLPCQRPA